MSDCPTGPTNFDSIAEVKCNWTILVAALYYIAVLNPGVGNLPVIPYVHLSQVDRVA